MFWTSSDSLDLDGVGCFTIRAIGKRHILTVTPLISTQYSVLVDDVVCITENSAKEQGAFLVQLFVIASSTLIPLRMASRYQHPTRRRRRHRMHYVCPQLDGQTIRASPHPRLKWSVVADLDGQPLVRAIIATRASCCLETERLQHSPGMRQMVCAWDSAGHTRGCDGLGCGGVHTILATEPEITDPEEHCDEICGGALV